MQQNNIRIVRKKYKNKFNYKIKYIIIFKKINWDILKTEMQGL